VFLVAMGATLLFQLIRGLVPNAVQQGGQSPEIKPRNPILGGVLVSMSNPYWWIWWATVGFAFMVEYEVSIRNWPALLGFFLGHEAGDLAWYLTVSVLVSLGRQKITGQVYRIVLAVCAAAIIGFGLYLGISALSYQA
jgi:threonine/homoserine/homoserine lactone efflux protein